MIYGRFRSPLGIAHVTKDSTALEDKGLINSVRDGWIARGCGFLRGLGLGCAPRAANRGGSNSRLFRYVPEMFVDSPRFLPLLYPPFVVWGAVRHPEYKPHSRIMPLLILGPLGGPLPQPLSERCRNFVLYAY